MFRTRSNDLYMLCGSSQAGDPLLASAAAAVYTIRRASGDVCSPFAACRAIRKMAVGSWQLAIGYRQRPRRFPCLCGEPASGCNDREWSNTPHFLPERSERGRMSERSEDRRGLSAANPDFRAESPRPLPQRTDRCFLSAVCWTRYSRGLLTVSFRRVRFWRVTR